MVFFEWIGTAKIRVMLCLYIYIYIYVCVCVCEKVNNRYVVVLIEFIFCFNLKFRKYIKQKHRSILYHTWLVAYPNQISLHRIVLYCIVSYRIVSYQIDDDDYNDDDEE